MGHKKESVVASNMLIKNPAFLGVNAYIYNADNQ